MSSTPQRLIEMDAILVRIDGVHLPPRLDLGRLAPLSHAAFVPGGICLAPHGLGQPLLRILGPKRNRVTGLLCSG